ncbi:5-(carboxyamino)imidazole ribonucleotide synthase [Ferrovibrio sp.]|uniref:5-(carboxyamino)imidazole ribonucleotide synthase n=1 Tax=Ferrovibrio sp. TaxID=1917215 RepID=UPI0025C6FC2E|nr:5-(carboxyamino)imidazole ribonucleotide synthase [Ferrovibrio sp.]MBX3455701.1 5-(carboxyamino)imidazole ribonucleotide synthase [Ferrovibrio sp.]
MALAPKGLAPGSRIGILGGGQLGRMIALAAAPLGYRCHIYAPENDPPAAQVSERCTRADYTDIAALQAFAAEVDVVTYEFENIPVEPVAALAQLIPVRPGVDALRITQDRLFEKDFANRHDAPTAPYHAVTSLADLQAAIAKLGLPLILKTRRMGYDGKGQVRIDSAEQAEAAFKQLGSDLLIAEGFIPFEREISVVLARGLDGAIASWGPVENIHRHHILWRSHAPAALDAALMDEANAMAQRLAEGLHYVGVLAVEMFVLPPQTKGRRILVNELAPRVHNSGHWTMDAALTSQFEQHVRAICGLPLGSTERLADAVMENLIGDEVDAWPSLLAEPKTKLHLYGKAEARPGRKMGHVTRLYPLGQRPAS